tara:strand:- start:368 stop:631 length:264 start_codon:yes stop_codon:yes gene_type:complete
MELKEVKHQISAQLEILHLLQSDIYNNLNEGDDVYSTQEWIEQQVKDTIHSLIDLINVSTKGMDNETYNFITEALNQITNNSFKGGN